LVDDAEQALEMMRALKKIGVSLSIDDFGTGYSSLNYLRHFPVDLLKIDGSFIREVVRNRGDAAITAAIVALARSLHLGILAEGVETRVQASFLRSIGCHDLQGLLFSGALPPEQLAPLLGNLNVLELAGVEPDPIVTGTGNTSTG
jgi:EAL domain-containing protein (putative c-di-GMP-specific phosphodiesterase class I)